MWQQICYFLGGNNYVIITELNRSTSELSGKILSTSLLYRGFKQAHPQHPGKYHNQTLLFMNLLIS
jgi:hypothetical protein